MHVADKSTCGNVFGSEGLESSVDGVNGTFYATLGIYINESGDNDLITGVERK